MSLSVLKDIRKIYAGLNANEVRLAAARELRIGLLATSENGWLEMKDFLLAGHRDLDARGQALRMLYRLSPGIGAEDGRRDDMDFVLVEPGLGLPRNGYPFGPAGALYNSGGSGGGASEKDLIDSIVCENQPVELALARSFPVFREAVARRIVTRISRENATLALVTALPNVLPSFVELPWVVGEFATDTAFLTMNQVRMALMMAAIYDRPVGYSEQKGSIAAIAGGAFGWRAIARELVGKIPLGGGLIPKAAIAYAGTWVVGTGLDRLYRTGAGWTRNEKREAWKSALARGRQIAAGLRH